MRDDFYVGYQPQAPPALAAFLRKLVVRLFGLGTVLAALLVVGQAPFPESRFEFGFVDGYKGRLVERPYPLLFTEEAQFLLVTPGKQGADEMVKGLDNRTVWLEGTMMRRGNDRGLEVRPSSLQVMDENAGAMTLEDGGQVTLSGEIVDSKCYLGVMNPGSGKVHRDCAARCIAGGIPPGFIARDSPSIRGLLLLTGKDGRPLRGEIGGFVGERVRVKGRLERLGGFSFLRVEPKEFERE